MVLVLAIAGCATQAKYESLLKTWEGAPVERLVTRWGVPQKTLDLGNGRKAYEYHDSKTQSAYTSTGYAVYKTDYEYSCATTFLISDKGLVEGTTFRGNMCRSR